MRNLTYEQEKILIELLSSLKQQNIEEAENILWSALILFQGYSFKTAKGLDFVYKIKNYEMFVNRKEKSITRSTINISLRKVIQLNYMVAGPKKIGTFGASYIYPIFQEFGLIKNKKKDECDFG